MSYAIVTGASRGIGRATAFALAERGLDVVLLARSEKALAETARAIEEKGNGVRALAIRCDLADPAQIEAATQRAQAELGAPLVVVNNAGIIHRALVHEMALDTFREVLDVNLTAAFLVTKSVLPSMLEAGRGRIVHVSSISATLGTARASAYCASKWGLVGFMKSLAEELRGTGLATLAVLPGSVDTDMLVGSGFAPQMTAEDVANTIVYAALDAPQAMNGSAIEIFG